MKNFKLQTCHKKILKDILGLNYVDKPFKNFLDVKEINQHIRELENIHFIDVKYLSEKEYYRVSATEKGRNFIIQDLRDNRKNPNYNPSKLPVRIQKKIGRLNTLANSLQEEKARLYELFKEDTCVDIRKLSDNDKGKKEITNYVDQVLNGDLSCCKKDEVIDGLQRIWEKIYDAQKSIK